MTLYELVNSREVDNINIHITHRWAAEEEEEESGGLNVQALSVSTASAAKRAILPTLFMLLFMFMFMLCLRPLLMYILNPGGGDVSIDMSNIVVEVEEDTKDCFFVAVAVAVAVSDEAAAGLDIETRTGIGMDSVLFRGMECPPIVTEVFLDSKAAFKPAAPSIILAVLAAAVIVSHYHIISSDSIAVFDIASVSQPF